ncbi:CopG family transcriptional regulator [Chroococcus sp. FPU101]|uniref:CopG family transcriptional regulator n=1 Tax=Chroococcus sp. FPU101 TaxID=1974212 RepID=UPI001A8E85D9|nr:CopG family transcriptional regulator [Chroococcus sp. FPU101]GFE71925.1 hypothetical protein CFPU101_45350 [Chroococcus sp. FPU101]
MSTVQVGIRILSHLFQKLQERAAQVNASKTEVILSALADYLENTRELQCSRFKLIDEGK